MGRKALPEKERQNRLKQRRDNYMKLVKKRLAAGLCRQCGKVRTGESKYFCKIHLHAHNERYKLRSFVDLKFSTLKANAKIRKIDFNINRSDFYEWYEKEEKYCHYCNVGEDKLKPNSDGKKKMLTIDRKNNNEGYNLDNICLACFRCNNSKSNFFTYQEWMHISETIIKPRLAEYHGYMDK